MIIERFLIVGLRAIGPTILNECIPGYLGEATENHRRGFQLFGNDGFYYAWVTNPLHALRFDSKKDTEPFIETLIHNDTGMWRPISVISIYL